MNTISFMSANFVARQIDYHMSDGWMQGDDATNTWFAPLATFEERLDEMLGEVADLGFRAIDIWSAHLNYQWATPAHIAIAKKLLETHELLPVSYAGGFGETPAELEAACRLCRELEIPVLGGSMPLLQSDRETAVSILRKHGLQYGFENHPEATPEEVLAKLGEGDEDVIGVALDTGWFATQGFDALEALKQLAPRLKHFHLKDIKAPREEKTGYMFIDMGHETCALGDGITPVEACAKILPELGYRGAIAIEHEPEEYDPREDCKLSLERLKVWLKDGVDALIPENPLGVVIVGCGNISAAYAREILTYPHIKFLGAQDLDLSRSEALVKEYGGKVYPTLEDVLADQQVEVVVNLTIHHAHVEVITKCLEAGKHVHSEKPLANSYEDAKGLVDLAKEKGLRLSCAPTTWLGEAQLTAWKMVREGKIGTPRVAYAEVNWGRIESWHPNPGPFYAVGPVFDVAVYPLTLLSTWFGPAKRVVAGGGVVHPNRQTSDGTPFTIEQPEWSTAIVEFEDGVQARITSSFYTGWNTRQHGLELHGDEAMIALDRWDVFDTGVYYAPIHQRGFHEKVPLLRPAFHGIEFARGLSDLAIALREDRPHRTTGDQAAHVVEIMQAVHKSLASGTSVNLISTFNRPTPLPWAE